MSEQIETVRNGGKRGKLRGTTDTIMATLQSLNDKFADKTQLIPVNRKFAQAIGLQGVMQEKVQFEKIGVPEEPEQKPSVKVIELE